MLPGMGTSGPMAFKTSDYLWFSDLRFGFRVSGLALRALGLALRA